MNTNADNATNTVRLPRSWFRTVLREYHDGIARDTWRKYICANSNTFHAAWKNPGQKWYLKKLAQRFCSKHYPDWTPVLDLLFCPNNANSTMHDCRAIRTAFLRWCIASTANRTT